MKATRFPSHPGKILTRSLQLGLSATAYLAKAITTKSTKHLCEGGKGCKGIKNILRDGKKNYQRSKRAGKPDASHLQKTERNARRSHNKVVLNTSVPYGNVETKRMRRKEDRKYINNLADYYGAIIRTLGAKEFQFPPPMKTYTEDGKIRWVYPGNTLTPEFEPQHTAPELDFVDMIRPHGLELIRQCMKYSVPMRDARRYLDELVRKLTPFLDQVYSGQRKIEYGFVRGSVKVLREVVLEIRAKYGGTNGRPLSITGEVSRVLRKRDETYSIQDSNSKVKTNLRKIVVEEDSFNTNSKYPVLDSFFSNLADSCDVTISSNWKKRVEKLQELTKKKTLTRHDARYIMNDLLEHSRKRGSSFHDFVSNADFTTRPFSLSSVFKYGDEMATERSEFLFACEVSIAEGRGRIDILLLRRKRLHRADDILTEYIWEPVMLIEVKTRCFYNLDLYATFTKSKNRSRRVIEYVKDLRRSEEDEWQKVIDATPIEYERQQLDAYEREIIQGYSRFARRDLDPPAALKKGVLVVDLKENWERLRDNIQEMVLDAYHRSEDASLSRREHFHLNPDDIDLRMGLVVFSDAERRESSPVKKIKYLDPFYVSKKRDDNREFILYLPVAGKGSPAQSASQIAAHWYGLELIHQRTKGTHRDILWFDLSGALATSEKRSRIFRTTLLSASIKRLLRKRVRFIDISESFSSYMQGDTALSQVLEATQTHLREARRLFIIVIGLDSVRSSTPRDRASWFDRFVAQFLNDVPEHSTLLWFDRPVPTTQTSQRYDTRSIAPFYGESPWMDLVDEVIYNVPTAPRRYGSYVPVEDDLRWLISEKNDDFTVNPILIPPLHKWGERFRSDSARDENITRQNTFYLRSSSYTGQRQVTSREYDEDDEESLLELLPHLQRFYKDKSEDENDKTEETIKMFVMETKPSSPQPFLSRVRFTPYQYHTEKERDGRVTRLEPLAHVNHQREYRESRLYGKPRKVTTQPPHIGLLKHNTQEMVSSARQELRGIRSVLKMSRRRHGEKKEWKGFLESLDKLVGRKNNNSTDMLSVLRRVKTVLESHPVSKNLWYQLRDQRTGIPQGLVTEQEQVLKQLIAQYPDLLAIIGNQHFLLLLTALSETDLRKSPRTIVERLWQYLIPWQLMILGFAPEYPPEHQTGESVLHRPTLIDRLARRAQALQDLHRKNEIQHIKFGKAVLVNDASRPPSLLLSFQTGPESREMNTIFVRLPSETKGPLVDRLRGFCREKPFWGESDLTRLGKLSDMVDLDTGTDIMVATQRGVHGLWVLNSEKDLWTAIGQLNYYSRPREQVTLLMSVTLREERGLTDISTMTVRKPRSYLKSMVKIGLETISAVFRKCEPVRCIVSVDSTEKMFRVSFLKAEEDKEITHLLTKRTVDVLEILRRPDFQCHQVVVDDHEMIWNRFRDIEYAGDAKILRPWVERREPFKTAELRLPTIADQFVQMDRRESLKLTVHHDRDTCPLCAVPQEELKERIQKHSGKTVEYLRAIEGSQSQPDDVLMGSTYRHGLCWRVELKAEEELPETVRGLEKIALSGPALATLLKTGALLYTEKGKWIRHEFDVPQTKSLPREFRESIILVDAYREIVPRALRKLQVPGAYLLKREEQWKVSPNFQEDAVVWSATSDTTGETYQGTSFTIPLYPDASLESTVDYIINAVNHTLAGRSIREPDTLEEHVRDMLRSRGYKSENLCRVEVERKGELVRFTIKREEVSSHEFGSVKVNEGMSLDNVFERLEEAVAKKISMAEYELESPNELRESLAEVLREISAEQGWASPEMEPVEQPLNILSVGIEFGSVVLEVKEFRRANNTQQALELVNGFLERVQPTQKDGPGVIAYLLDALLLKVEMLVSGDLTGSVDTVMLVDVLDQIKEYSYRLEPRVLNSNSRFGKGMRWALALRESIKKDERIH